MDLNKLKQEAKEKYNERLKQIGYKIEYNDESYNDGYLDSAEPREKRIAELEEKISVLLSCKKCPDNKGGFICQKEYENKCLSQKIQYIKELKEEIAELEEKNIELLGNLAFTENALNNAKAQIEKMKCCCNCKYYSMEFLPYFCIKKQIPTHCTELCCKWDISEMNEDVRKHAEKIDSEVEK